METLSIKFKKSLSFSLLENILLKHWRVEFSTGNTLIVHDDKSRAYLHPNEESKEKDKNGLLLDYSDIKLAKRIIEIISNDSDITVDNDFGTILSGSEFVARCKAEKEWDWRK